MSNRLQQARASWEREFLIDVMIQHNGNVTRAAMHLEMERQALQRLIKNHGIDVGTIRKAAA